MVANSGSSGGSTNNEDDDDPESLASYLVHKSLSSGLRNATSLLSAAVASDATKPPLILAQALPITWLNEQQDRLLVAPLEDQPLAPAGGGLFDSKTMVDSTPAPGGYMHQQLDHESTWSQLLSALFLHSNGSSNYNSDVAASYPSSSFEPEQSIQLGGQLQINWFNLILALVLVMLMLTTAIGNLFVIVAILIERNLRTIGNYLVLSLAIADLLVACLVMPLAGIYQILERWTLGVLLCDIWTSTDVFCCTASILHLLAIALDRYWAVTRVDYIRCQRNERRILSMILFVWMAASIISLAPVFGWKDAQFELRITKDQECLLSQDIGYQIFATCTTFYFPLTLTLIFYWKIYQVARKRIRRKPGGRRATKQKVTQPNPSTSSSTSAPTCNHQQSNNQHKTRQHNHTGKQSGLMVSNEQIQTECSCLCHQANHQPGPLNGPDSRSGGKKEAAFKVSGGTDIAEINSGQSFAASCWSQIDPRMAPKQGSTFVPSINGISGGLGSDIKRARINLKPGEQKDGENQVRARAGQTSAAGDAKTAHHCRKPLISSLVTTQSNSIRPKGLSDTNILSIEEEEEEYAVSSKPDAYLHPIEGLSVGQNIVTGNGFELDSSHMNRSNNNNADYSSGQTTDGSTGNGNKQSVCDEMTMKEEELGAARRLQSSPVRLDANGIGDGEEEKGTNSSNDVANNDDNERQLPVPLTTLAASAGADDDDDDDQRRRQIISEQEPRTRAKARAKGPTDRTGEKRSGAKGGRRDKGSIVSKHSSEFSTTTGDSASSLASSASVSASSSLVNYSAYSNDCQLLTATQATTTVGESSTSTRLASMAGGGSEYWHRNLGRGTTSAHERTANESLDDCCGCCCPEQLSSNKHLTKLVEQGPTSSGQGQYPSRLLIRPDGSGGKPNQVLIKQQGTVMSSELAEPPGGLPANQQTTDPHSVEELLGTCDRRGACRLRSWLGPLIRAASGRLGGYKRTTARPRDLVDSSGDHMKSVILVLNPKGAQNRLIPVGCCSRCSCSAFDPGAGKTAQSNHSVQLAAVATNHKQSSQTTTIKLSQQYQQQQQLREQAADGLESKRERKAAKTLAIITGVFVMCWLPFFIMAIAMPLLKIKPHKYLFAVLLWLGYVNSMLNPIIYTIFSPDFRKAFKRLLCAMDTGGQETPARRAQRLNRAAATARECTYANN